MPKLYIVPENSGNYNLRGDKARTKRSILNPDQYMIHMRNLVRSLIIYRTFSDIDIMHAEVSKIK